MLEHREEGQREGINPTVVIAVIVGIVALIFVLSNLGGVSINFLFIHFRWPAWLMFALMIGVGVLLDRVFLWWWGRRKAARTLPPTAADDRRLGVIHAASSDGVSVAIHDLAGSSPHPIVLLAHATGFHGHAYLPIAKALAPRFHSWGMDFRGHGDTPLPAGWAASWDGYGDDAFAAASALAALPGAAGGIVAFGHSMGGAALRDGGGPPARAVPAARAVRADRLPQRPAARPRRPEPAARRRPPSAVDVRLASTRRSPTTRRRRRCRRSTPTPSTPTCATGSVRTATSCG